MTVYDKTDHLRMDLSLVSLRESDDRLTCDGQVTVRLGKGRRCVAVRSLPGLKSQPIKRQADGTVQFKFNDLDILQIFELEYA